MASIPNAGFPDFPKVTVGKGRALPTQTGQVIQFYGFDNLEAALATALESTPTALAGCLVELGFFGETETKLRTPVEYGVLRASIGHFDPKGVFRPRDESGKFLARSGEHKAKKEDAVFEMKVIPGGECYVLWGTNVEYGPWIEWGFTMHTRRAVYFPGVGFRMVNPFSYRGAHMFELGLQRTAEAAPKILLHWAQEALTSGGLQQL